MIRRPPRSTLSSSSAASDVYKRQQWNTPPPEPHFCQCQISGSSESQNSEHCHLYRDGYVPPHLVFLFLPLPPGDMDALWPYTALFSCGKQHSRSRHPPWQSLLHLPMLLCDL